MRWEIIPGLANSHLHNLWELYHIDGDPTEHRGHPAYCQSKRKAEILPQWHLCKANKQNALEEILEKQPARLIQVKFQS